MARVRPGARLGVLRVDRGAVHGVRARRMARPPRDGGPGPAGAPAVHRLRRRRRGPAEATPATATTVVGTIWCDMPAFARFSYWGDEEATRAGLAGRGLHGGRSGPARCRRLSLPLGPPARPHHQRRGQRLPGRGGGGAVRRARRRCSWRCSACPTSSGARGCAWPTSPSGSGVEEALRAAAAVQLAPYKRPKDYFATGELPHTATGKLLRRAVPAHLGLAGRRSTRPALAVRIGPCPTPRSIPPPARPRRRSRRTPRPRWRRSCSGPPTPSSSTAPPASPSGPAT